MRLGPVERDEWAAALPLSLSFPAVIAAMRKTLAPQRNTRMQNGRLARIL